MSYIRAITSAAVLFALTAAVPATALAQGRNRGGGHGGGHGSGGGHAVPRGSVRVVPQGRVGVVPYYRTYRPGFNLGFFYGRPGFFGSYVYGSPFYGYGYPAYGYPAYGYGYPYGYPGYGYGGYYAPYGYGYGGYSGQPYGGLRIDIPEREAEVYVDGYFAGVVDDFDGRLQQANLEAGPHRIEVRLPGFETLAFDVRIEPGRTITYRGGLRPY
jgi:hypothetical protein